MTGDPVIESGNLLLYSRLRHHLTNIKPGDYVVVRDEGTNVTLPADLYVGHEGVVLQIGETFVARLRGYQKGISGVNFLIEVPIFLGPQASWGQTVVPENSVQGKVIAVLNPPSKRRWLP